MDQERKASPLAGEEPSSPLVEDDGAGMGGDLDEAAELDEDVADAPVRFTEAAIRKVQEFAREYEEARGKNLRMFVQGVEGRRTADFEYGFTFDEPVDGDEEVDHGEITVLVDTYSYPYLKGHEVDFVDDISGSGFVVNDLARVARWDDPVARKVQKVIDEQINPGVASHGGNVSMLDYKEGTVYVEMGGGCQGCGMADVTLKQGIERILKDAVPEVKEILDTTDHAAGDNPFYQSSKGGF